MSDSAEVIKLNGAPGAGKTYTLRQYVEEEKENGLALEDMMYLTFTRSGRRETEETLERVFPNADEDEIGKRAKTVHGAACSTALEAGIIEDVGRQVIQESTNGEIYETFCESRAMRYDTDGGDPLKRGGGGTTAAGNRLMAAASWLKMERKPYSKVAQAPVNLPMAPTVAQDLVSNWDEFKRTAAELRMFEHADYVDAVIDEGLAPNASVLFIDEFQDLSPQEYLLFKTWRDSGAVDRIYIAGDVNQSVYSFRAARPVYFAETPADDVEDRRVSYRCPEAIAAVARGILDAHPGTDPNGFRSNREGGTVTRPRFENASALGDSVRRALGEHESDAETGNTVFLLARTNRNVRAVANALEQEGVRYDTLKGYTPWTEDLQKLHATLRQIRATADLDTLSRSVLNQYRAAASGTRDMEETREFLASATASQLVDNLDNSEYPYYEQERLKNALLAGGANDPQDVKVGTIHAAKGLEAPCVYLFDAYTRSLENRYYDGENAAEEHRLYYVGATRASETLHIASYSRAGSRPFPAFQGDVPVTKADEEVVA